MTAVNFMGRQAARLENEILRVTVLHWGGHIAEVFDKRVGIKPAVDSALAFNRTIRV